MTGLLHGLIDIVRRVCQVGTIAAFSVLAIVTLMQVVGRIPWIDSPAYTEEVARFALIYLVAFSCGLAALRGELVNVDLFIGLLPPRGRKFAEALSLVLTIGFAAAIVPGSWGYMLNGFGERARAIDFSMVWVYAAVLIIPLALIFFCTVRLFGYRIPKSELAEEADGATALTRNSEDGRC